MSDKSFSKRLGVRPESQEITIREGAPEGLVEYLVQLISSWSYEADFLRTIVCFILKKVPDRNNWSEGPINSEVIELLQSAPWYYTYDTIETVYKKLRLRDKDSFETELNDFFVMNGVGWKLENGKVEFRGEKSFEVEVGSAIRVLSDADQKTAKNEIQEAINDLSRRPSPDVTGAIQHSMASLECVARQVAGNDKMTLGELINRHSDILPSPLNQAVSKIWGYTSEQGRHLKEGKMPAFEEAELVVGLCAALSTYLSKKLTAAELDSDPF